MRVDHLQLDAAEIDAHPDRAALLVRGRQGTGSDESRRQGGEDGVAVFFFLDMQGRVEMRIHVQMRGDRVGLVYAAGPRPPHVDLLHVEEDNYEKYAIAVIITFSALIIAGLMAVSIAWNDKPGFLFALGASVLAWVSGHAVLFDKPRLYGLLITGAAALVAASIFSLVN